MWFATALAASTTFSPDGAWAFDHWTQADGLPLEAVKYAVADRDGYVWVATLEGLYRFDGSTFTLVHRETFPGLRVNRITGLALDPAGDLWVLDETGVVCRVDPTAPDPQETARCWSLPPGPLRVGPRGEVYAADGLLRLGADGPAPWSGLPEGARVADFDRAGFPLFAAEPDRYGWLVGAGRASTRRSPNGEWAWPLEDGAGGRWVVAGDELWRVDPAPVERVASRLTGWVEDAEGWVWFRTRDAAGRVRGAEIEHVAPPWSAPLQDDYHAVRAGDGALWESMGAWVGRDRVRMPVPGCRLAPDAEDGVWLACPDGLRHARRALARSHPPADPDHTEAWGVAIDAEGGHYETSRGGLWYRASGARGAVPVHAPDGRRLRGAEAREGGIWGELDGLACRLDGAACATPLVPGDAAVLAVEAEHGPLSARPFPLPDGTRLLSVFGKGLAVLGDGGLRWREAPSPGLDIRGFHRWGDTLWLGTEDRGLCRADLAAGVLSAPIRCLEHGAIGTHVTDIRGDRHGRLWLATNRGVVVVALSALEAGFADPGSWVPALRLDTRDGMASRDTNAGFGRTAEDPLGWFWYPTMRGTAGIDVERVTLEAPPAPRLESVRVGGELQPPGPLELPSDHGPVQITWSVPEFVRPEQVQFRNRLGGDWRPPGPQRSEVFDRLPPGASSFEVQAALGGSWSPVTTLAVHRAPTFVESRLFPLALTLGGGVLVGVAARVRGAARRARQADLEAEVVRRTEELRASNRLVAEQRDRLHRQAAELQELGRLKSRLLANLSHELRTPLMLVLAPLERLSRGATGETAETLRLVRRNAERLSELIQQLFDAARLESGRLPLRLRRLDLAAHARDVADRFRPAMEAAGLEFTVATPTSLMAWFDPDLLEKVLTNLLGNALKFTPRGEVGVRLEVRGESALLTVHDTGKGIPAEHLDRVFDRFYQVDAGDDRAAEGAGIGLSLARELVELHGGSIRVSSRLGEGSAFEVVLPLGAAHVGLGDLDLATPVPDAATPASPPGPGPAVLVVEDHAELRNWLADTLREHYPVVTAADGVEALERLAEHPVALVVADVMMPRMDGLALCRAIRGQPGRRDLPVLLVSARGEGARAEAEAAGATAYLQKPVTLARLQEVALQLAPPPGPDAPEETGPAGVDPRAPLTEVDREALARIEQVARAHLADPAFTVEVLGKKVAMSRRTLQRALHRLTGQPPNTWLQELRLTEAQQRLRRGESVAEAAAAIGWTPSYLARVYQAWFGRKPSEDRP